VIYFGLTRIGGFQYKMDENKNGEYQFCNLLYF
jgi:hypothetical protein